MLIDPFPREPVAPIPIRVSGPLSAFAAGVTQVVAAGARRAGLGQIYAHRLRHTAATQMLRAGASLPEIGQLLRHRRALTTAIYAEVNHRPRQLLALAGERLERHLGGGA